MDELASFIIRVLLRYFRKGEYQKVNTQGLRGADKDLLLLQWSISQPVEAVCSYLVQHPHELRAAFTSQVSTDQSLRGAILAARTTVEQSRTGDPCRFVFAEPVRTYDGGPNRVLGWTIAYARTLGRRFRSLLTLEATYHSRTVEVLRLLETASRLLPSVTLAAKPTPGDLRSARSSRSPLYRRAAEAYDYLQRIEKLDERALSDLFSNALVGPMEEWRQFELALALAIAGEISVRVAEAIDLKMVLPGSLDALIEVGNYVVTWQKAAPTYQAPRLDEWERKTDDLIRAYGISPGYDRPDVVVYDRQSNRVLAVGEAKYFESDSWRDRLRDAIGQVVMYARGYGSSQDVDELISRSVVALWTAKEDVRGVKGAPVLATFSTLEAALREWGDRCFGPAV